MHCCCRRGVAHSQGVAVVPEVFDTAPQLVHHCDDSHWRAQAGLQQRVASVLSDSTYGCAGHQRLPGHSLGGVPDAPLVTLYSGWSYVLVLAGPEQAASWRRSGATPIRRYLLPDVMFPADRSWLVSTLWDDDWSCVGGPVRLVDSLLNHPDLRSRVRRVSLDEDATPPGHRAI
jgi:hypothetical protein